MILTDKNTQLRIQITKTRKENEKLKTELGAIYLETEGAYYLARQLRLEEDDPPTL